MSMVSYIQRILKEYAENMKKIMEAVWELRAKKHSQIQSISTQIELNWPCYLAGNYIFSAYLKKNPLDMKP